MAKRSGSDVVAGPAVPADDQSPIELARADPGTLNDPGHTHATHHGRPSSWVAVSFMLAGFVCGGLALVFASWPAFWAGVGLVVVGGLLATMTDILEDWY